tara:strand:+ start:212 stop:472 length:261 start_codon:yes stop_codon:yes gene_type:complete
MYKITTRTKKAAKLYNQFIDNKLEIKLELLKTNPRGNLGAHKLSGKFKGLWSCWLKADLRMIYEINDIDQEIIVVDIGNHKIYSRG